MYVLFLHLGSGICNTEEEEVTRKSTSGLKETIEQVYNAAFAFSTRAATHRGH